MIRCSHRSWTRPVILAMLLSAASALAGSPLSHRQAPAAAESERYPEHLVRPDALSFMCITSLGRVLDAPPPPVRDCNQIASYTDVDFSGSASVNAQAGFAETEIAACSYTISPSQFPIKVDMIEVITATSGATVTTTTEWSILVWDGPPNTGTLIGTFSSDGLVLPHIQMPPGTNATNLQFSIDPGDPDQIILTNAGGTGVVSFGFRIDKHNNQTANPCFTAPPTGSNAFPATDTSGLASDIGNWLWAVDCGFLAGWNTFADLGPFKPSGDWAMRMHWSSLNCTPGIGACCLPDGSCSIMATADCASAGGTYQGDGSDCTTANCTAADQACCFPSTGGCLDLNPDDCTLAGGIPGGTGSTCSTHVCFPEGACCLPDGSCQDGLTPDDCAALGGDFQGDGTDCATTVCPEPEGACCFDSGGCLILPEADCMTAGGTWAGSLTDCSDNNGNFEPDACEPPACPADLNNDGFLNLADVTTFIDAFTTGDLLADINGDGFLNLSDVTDFIAAFAAGC